VACAIPSDISDKIRSDLDLFVKRAVLIHKIEVDVDGLPSAFSLAIHSHAHYDERDIFRV